MKKQIIFELETSPNGLTATEIVRWMRANPNKNWGISKKSHVASVSVILAKMWKNDEVEIDPYRKGPKGGNVYKYIKE